LSITLKNLTRRYGPARAVDNLSATIPTGCFFTVLGPSGCGKSTLLRMIAGLEPLDEGRIALGDRTVAGPGLHLSPEARGVGCGVWAWCSNPMRCGRKWMCWIL